MKRAVLVTLAAAVVLAATLSTAEARARPSRGARFEANKTFGLGLMLGAPTAVCGKLFLGPDTALDFGVGAYYHWRDRDGLHVHGDFLWHPVVLARTPDFWLPLYFGVGLRFLDLSDNNRDSHVGVRVPVGLSFDFENLPLDIFLEVALVLDILVDNDNDRGDFAGAFGARYWF
jgi:hypothetical protein